MLRVRMVKAAATIALGTAALLAPAAAQAATAAPQAVEAPAPVADAVQQDMGWQ
ncbi:hypothetical protein [Streptomyces sp. NPDC051286]|uniref:hypothetical protein n=1 Tax=Streptomyces sp. NPDC051286 TaxID=3365647 RepID=UPI00379C8834